MVYDIVISVRANKVVRIRGVNNDISFELRYSIINDKLNLAKAIGLSKNELGNICLYFEDKYKYYYKKLKEEGMLQLRESVTISDSQDLTNNILNDMRLDDVRDRDKISKDLGDGLKYISIIRDMWSNNTSIKDESAREQLEICIDSLLEQVNDFNDIEKHNIDEGSKDTICNENGDDFDMEFKLGKSGGVDAGLDGQDYFDDEQDFRDSEFTLVLIDGTYKSFVIAMKILKASSIGDRVYLGISYDNKHSRDIVDKLTNRAAIGAEVIPIGAIKSDKDDNRFLNILRGISASELYNRFGAISYGQLERAVEHLDLVYKAIEICEQYECSNAAITLPVASMTEVKLIEYCYKGVMRAAGIDLYTSELELLWEYEVLLGDSNIVLPKDDAKADKSIMYGELLRYLIERYNCVE